MQALLFNKAEQTENIHAQDSKVNSKEFISFIYLLIGVIIAGLEYELEDRKIALAALLGMSEDTPLTKMYDFLLEQLNGVPRYKYCPGESRALHPAQPLQHGPTLSCAGKSLIIH